MKKQWISLLLVSVLGSIPMQAAEPVIKSIGESKYVIETGNLSMTIDAFKFKDAEVISQLPMRETFGSTFWTSPQNEWNWPPVAEYDKLPYTVRWYLMPVNSESITSQQLISKARALFN